MSVTIKSTKIKTIQDVYISLGTSSFNQLKIDFSLLVK